MQLGEMSAQRKDTPIILRSMQSQEELCYDSLSPVWASILVMLHHLYDTQHHFQPIEE